MSHGAIYRACPKAACVIHIHSKAIFGGMLRANLLSTPKDAAYGTPEMARAISNAAGQAGDGQIVLAGHDEGVITWGASVDDALALAMKLYNDYCVA
jgi:ribulose-5-phosphate 4-epimerase/fuculose-1-phosphate aldolase